MQLLYMIDRVHGRTDEEARSALGIVHPSYIDGVIEFLQAELQGGRPETRGRKTKFTPTVMQHATSILAESGPMTTREVISELEERGILQPPTNAQNFLRHLREHLATTGHRLYITTSGQVFGINHEGALRRKDWAEDMLAFLEDHQVEHIWFMDVTTMLCCPHPKGAHACIMQCTNKPYGSTALIA